MQPNVEALLNNFIPSFKFDIKKFKYIKCKATNCKICKLSLNISHLFRPKFNNFFLNISSNTTCDTVI